jgi:serine/threonine protein kinase
MAWASSTTFRQNRSTSTWSHALNAGSGHLVERPGVRDRFLREVQSAAKLQHKNIVAAYSAMRLGESIILAMEYIDGEDLAKVVKSRGPLPVVHACYFIHQAALGLQHAHERGMIHRDIKPANLIFATGGPGAGSFFQDGERWHPGFESGTVTRSTTGGKSGIAREGFGADPKSDEPCTGCGIPCQAGGREGSPRAELGELDRVKGDCTRDGARVGRRSA